MIDGRHMSGRTNSDVVSLLGVAGTTRIFPSIICRSFTNLATVTFRSMNVETLTTNSFVDCRRLEFIDLAFNKIDSVHQHSFYWSNVLRFLNLESNSLKSIPDLNLTSSLETIYLGHNIGLDIPITFFSTNSNLRSVFMNNCNISIWKNSWFNIPMALDTLDIQNNQIRFIPNSAFHVQNNLRRLYISNNKIEALNFASFANLTLLEQLFANDNEIGMIERRILEQPINLNSVYLSDNNCISRNFDAFYSYRTSYLNTYFNECFNNFNNQVIHVFTDGSPYTWYPISANSIRIMIRAAQHADIILSGEFGSDANPNVEIFLGNNFNTVSNLVENGRWLQNQSIAFVLSEFEWKNFTISWENPATITVSRGGFNQPLLAQARTQIFTINAIGVRTRANHGNWEIRRRN